MYQVKDISSILNVGIHPTRSMIQFSISFFPLLKVRTSSKIFGKWIFFKLADMVTFPTKTSSMVKKLQICISLVSNLKKTKQCLFYLYCFINGGNHVFYFPRGFFVDFSKTTPTLRQLLVPKSLYVWKKLGDKAVDWNKHL